jgi:hypothetical protein
MMTVFATLPEGSPMSAPISAEAKPGPLLTLPPELCPSIEHLVTEDGAPVDSIYCEKQMRLLTRPLYTSWPGPEGDQRFVALANVGLFFGINEPPLVPEVLLSLGVKMPDDTREKKNRSYFVWIFGKPPNATLEIVSNREGGELDSKKKQYARIGVAFYIVWDPLGLISSEPLVVFALNAGKYQPVSPAWLDALGPAGFARVA